MGSTVAITDASGAIATEYTYEAYGTTTQTGTANENSQQYTGRENDGTGLYYYRARYYSPMYGRFVAEDPIGFDGGINLYAYVNGNPVTGIDPLGLADETGQPPLKRIHSDSTTTSGSNYQYWSKQPTEKIVESLKPKPGNLDSLKAAADGRVFDGNTRVKVLEERGVEVNNLPREIYRPGGGGIAPKCFIWASVFSVLVDAYIQSKCGDSWACKCQAPYCY